MKKLNGKNKIIIIVVLVVVASLAYYFYFTNSKMYEEFENIENTKELISYEETLSSENDTKENEEISYKKTVIVHITGSVKNWGIVELPENSRIMDAVEAAGGFTEDADTSKVNLAYVIEDGMKITIPSKNENTETVSENINATSNTSTNSEKTGSIDESVAYVSTESGIFVENEVQKSHITANKKILVNINSATQTDLESLPGIGPSTAIKIINYRNENGKFKSIEDLKNVSGIGEAKFNNIKEYICV
ncbi:MAG: helix-hairpin-helix domain-containing protein [Clostridia bacterium]|nr:helix-hairpin-helix domain-containing protein [Clostridia bacterium]